VLGIDFALRCGSAYATVLIDAVTRCVDVVPGRTADIAEKWLRDHPRDHPGAEVVCRDGSGACGAAVSRALPGAVQVSDRWHLWHLLAEAFRREVAAHCACWAKGLLLQEGKRAATTLERWHQFHDLRSQNVGLLECARRLNLSLNTVKRYDRTSEPERLQRVPKYRPTLVDSHRDYLRKRRAEQPASRSRSCCRRSASAATRGSSNLLVRYINQGRLDSDRPHLSPRRAARIMLTRPDRLTAGQQETLAALEGACPETMSAVPEAFPGRVKNRGGQPGDAAVVDAGDGVAEIDGNAADEAGRHLEDTPFPSGAGKIAAGQGGGCGVPVDGGHRDAAAGAVFDEPAGEVVATQECPVAGEQGDLGFERVEPGGAGPEGGGQVVSCHGVLRERIRSRRRCRGRRGCRRG
jgi:hypothetical protein